MAYDSLLEDVLRCRYPVCKDPHGPDFIAASAYRLADAMLRARAGAAS